MSFRTRLALVAAAAVGIAVVVAASVVVFVVVHNELSGTGRQRASQAGRSGDRRQPRAGRAHIEGGYLEVSHHHRSAESDSRPARRHFRPSDAHPVRTGSLPRSKDALQVAKTGHWRRFSDATISQSDYRVYTNSGPVPRPSRGNTYALQVARSLGEVNRTLHRITHLPDPDRGRQESRIAGGSAS